VKIFLDTANLDEIQRASDFGLLDGITTNPTLAAKEGRPFRELILEACEIVKDGVVNAEVVSTDTEGMLREGRELASWHPNIVVKVPMTPVGVRALHVLHGEGIRINVTLVFSAAQALLVAKAGAYIVSPSWDDWMIRRRTGFTCYAKLWISTEPINSPRRFWLPASATRSTLSRRQKWASTLARCHSRFSSSFSSTR
jgi:Transaldolase/Fructose-6-phosphate aldolase